MRWRKASPSSTRHWTSPTRASRAERHPAVPHRACHRSMSKGTTGVRGLGRSLLLVVGFFVLVGILWEAFKWLFGDPWRVENLLGSGNSYFHVPPFRLLQATDI